MPVTALTLASLLHACAPNIGARTMTAIVQVESGGRPLTIHDNTLARTFEPVDVREAVAWSEQLLRLHHSIDLGIAQINNVNLALLGMSLDDAFDPCTNVRAGGVILADDYAVASRQFGPGQLALRRAIGAYNSGSIYAGDAYVDAILVAAGVRPPATAVHVPDLRTVAAPALGAATIGPAPRPLPAFARPAATVLSQVTPPSPYSAPILVPVATPTPSPTATPSPAPTTTATAAAPAASPSPKVVVLPAPR